MPQRLIGEMFVQAQSPPAPNTPARTCLNDGNRGQVLSNAGLLVHAMHKPNRCAVDRRKATKVPYAAARWNGGIVLNYACEDFDNAFTSSNTRRRTLGSEIL